MMNKINWQEVKDQFEKEISDKLEGLPGHREVPEESREFRNIISHELLETAPKTLFRQLIELLLSGGRVDVQKARKVYLEPELEKERRILTKHAVEFEELKRSAKKWVEENLAEEKLQEMWKTHKSWLPRRYGIYSRKISFQKIAADTLARFYLIKKC